MKELIKIQTELKAPKGQFNSFGNYKYRSCEDILEALKPMLQELNCYLNVTDEIKQLGDRYYVEATATLFNPSGASVSAKASAREPLAKKGMDEAQITGATSSYARKYALNGLFAIDDTKDADATNKHESDTTATETQPARKPAKTKQAETKPQNLEIVPFGKYKGQRWDSIDSETLSKTISWLDEQIVAKPQFADNNKRLQAYIQHIVDVRLEEMEAN